MMKTRSKLLKEAYPVLLLISLLMTWELTSHGSPSSPPANILSPISWSQHHLNPEPVRKPDQPMAREPSWARVDKSAK